MDLRPLNLSAKQIQQAAHVLNYQPFIITDDFQTGVAYSWLYSGDPRVKPPVVFQREQWDKISKANQRLRLMYDDFLDEIARRYPGGSLFDIGCNNGYFPVGAERRHMRNCVGSDGARHANAMAFLNGVLGTTARFITALYNPATGKITQYSFLGVGRFDVVVTSAIMCHMPNPLLFLSALGTIAKEAIFFWGRCSIPRIWSRVTIRRIRIYRSSINFRIGSTTIRAYRGDYFAKPRGKWDSARWSFYRQSRIGFSPITHIKVISSVRSGTTFQRTLRRSPCGDGTRTKRIKKN